jgi:cytochrome P450
MTIPFAPLLFIPLAPFLLKNAKQVFEYTRQKVQARMAQNDKERPDFMARVLKHNTNDGNGITVLEIESTFEILVMAGSETTATLMSGLMWLVHRHPEVLAKLKKEVRESFARDEEITLVKIDQLPYLQATIQESFRIYPPIPIALPRTTPPEGISICGQWVPGNTIVGIPHRSAYLSPTNFAEPLSFVPERFVAKGRPAKFENDRRNVLQPFSAGPRNCLGKNLAYAEMKLTITRLMYNFDFEVVDTKTNWYEQKVWGLYDKAPLMLKVYDRTR